MKNLFFILIGGALLLPACKEIDPPLPLSVSAADSAYTVSPAPAATPHNILVEEFTGQSCSNCPAAHDKLLTLVGQNPGRINVVGLYINGFGQAQPPSAAMFDFRTNAATTIATNIFNTVSEEPVGGIDRVPTGNIGPTTPLQLSSGQWSGQIATQLNLPDSLNLQVATSYNSSDSINTITATIVYTQPVSVPQYLSVVVTEDSIIDMQEYPATPTSPYPSGYDTNYVFTFVLRDIVTAVAGDAILSTMAVKPAGQALRRRYSYKTRSGMNLKHCKVTAFVANANGSDVHVVQSVQTPFLN